MNLLDYIRALRQRWWVVVVAVLLFAAGAALFSLRAIPTYQSSASVLVSTPADTLTELQAGSQFAQSRASTYAALVTTASVLQRAVRTLGGDTDEQELAQHITASVQTGTSLIVVTATADSAKLAGDRANAVAGAVNSEVQSLEITTTSAASPVLLQVVQAAPTDSSPVGAGPTRNAVLGGIAGLAIGIGFVILAATLDSRLRTPRDLTSVVGHSPAAIVPRRRALAGVNATDGRREAFRTLRASLGLGDEGHSIAVAPVSAGQSAAHVSAELGRVLAEGGLRVVAVDADLRPDRAQMSTGATDSEQGLAEVLERRADLADAVRATSIPRLSTLTAGVPSSRHGQTLNRQAMTTVLARLMQEFDVVLVACPPLLARSDAAITASVADTALVIVEARRTTRGDLGLGLDLLRGVGVTRPAVMLHNVTRTDMVVTAGSGLGTGA